MELDAAFMLRRNFPERKRLIKKIAEQGGLVRNDTIAMEYRARATHLRKVSMHDLENAEGTGGNYLDNLYGHSEAGA